MRLHLSILGRVQGVGYRQWLRAEADERGVFGWARNRRDGTVEAMLDGPNAVVEALVRLAMSGPVGAKVDAINRTEIVDDGLLDRFEIRPTE